MTTMVESPAMKARRWAPVVLLVLCLMVPVGIGRYGRVALVAWLRRDARWTVVTPLVAGLVGIVVWWVTKPDSMYSTEFEPDRRLAVFLTLLGGLWTSGTVDVALVIDSEGVVVGGGITGIARPDAQQQVPGGSGEAGWRAVAASGAKDLAIIVSSGGVFYRI